MYLRITQRRAMVAESDELFRETCRLFDDMQRVFAARLRKDTPRLKVLWENLHAEHAEVARQHRVLAAELT